METGHNAKRDLEGMLVLLVEDDTFIMLDLEAILSEAGATVVGPCRSANEALPLIDGARLDAAIIDFGLDGDTAPPIATRLTRRGTPFLFYTGQVEADPRLAEWQHASILQKPARPAAIVAAVKALRFAG